MRITCHLRSNEGRAYTTGQVGIVRQNAFCFGLSTDPCGMPATE